MKRYSAYIDLDDNHSRISTIPPSAVVTTLIPDIVIVDEENKCLGIFELTCPGEARIDIANSLKIEMYAHLANDITQYKTKVNAFEIGSHTGQITKRNKECLSNLHRFCPKAIKKSFLIKKISAITFLGSYHIFNSRDEQDWLPSSHILGPFKYHSQEK